MAAAEPLAQPRGVIGHRVLADAEVVGDFLLPLARCKTGEDIGLAAAQRGPQALCFSRRTFQGIIDFRVV